MEAREVAADCAAEGAPAHELGSPMLSAKCETPAVAAEVAPVEAPGNAEAALSIAPVVAAEGGLRYPWDRTGGGGGAGSL